MPRRQGIPLDLHHRCDCLQGPVFGFLSAALGMDTVPFALAIDLRDQAIKPVASRNRPMRVGDPLQDTQARFQIVRMKYR